MFTVSLHCQVSMVGPGIAWNVPMSAQASALVAHNPMLFVTPPPPPKVVQVGDYVQVHTTAGDWLNLRRKPGLDGNTIAALPPGGFALVVDGPVQANGLQWWRIYAIRAKIYGWCVDQADTVSTLIPIASSF